MNQVWKVGALLLFGGLGCASNSAEGEATNELTDGVSQEEGADAVYFIPEGPATPSPPADVTHGIEDEDAENDAFDGTADSIQDGETGTETFDGEEGELDDGGSTNGDDIVELSDGEDGAVEQEFADADVLLPTCPEGAYCDDEDPCTFEDKCQPDETCIGTPKSCDDGNPCTEDTCDAGDGACSHLPLANETSCGENLACLDGVCETLCADGSIGSCPVVVEGDVHILDEGSFAVLESVTHIQGSLTITSYNGILSLPTLEEVTGSVTLSASALVSGLNLPKLTSVGGSLHFEGGDALNSVNLPMLGSIQGVLRIENLETVLAVSLPALNTLSSGLVVTGNQKLESLLLDEMTGPIPEMVVINNPKFPQCAVYALKDQLLPVVQDIASGNCDFCSCSTE